MQYSAYKSTPLETTPVARDKNAKATQKLPILPGMSDAENQPIRLDLPEDIMRRLRSWD